MIQDYKIFNKFKQFSFFNSNPVLWLYGFSFLNNIELLLKQKSIIIIKKSFNIVSNTIFINLELFFLTSKTSDLRKNLQKAIDITSSINFKKFDNLFFNFIFKQFKFFKVNTISLNLSVLNFKIDKQNLRFVFKKFKKAIPLLFSRRFNLFLDFVKIFCLLSRVNISSQKFLFFLQKIFKNLTKRQHMQFLSFMKLCFNLLIYDTKNFSNQKISCIKGIKLLVNGKLRGKPRASSYTLIVGKMSTQTINSKIDYSKTHVYTLYGVFGFKLWICYNF